MATNDKWELLKKRLQSLNIDERDIIEKFILGSGSGGQKINKTSSCVYLKHIPSGIEIKCQRSRSRSQNRLIAYTEMCDELVRRVADETQSEQHLREKLRRQKQRRTRAQQEKNLQSKKRRSQVKSLRKSQSD